MAHTTAALLDRALAIVSQVGSGQVASDDDRQHALTALVALLEELSTREILALYIDEENLDSEDIPSKVFNPLANILAADLQTTFAGVVIDDATREGLIGRLIRVTCSGPSYDAAETENF